MKLSNGLDRLRTWLRTGLSVLLMASAFSALAVEPGREPVREAEGTVQELRFAENQMIVNGMQYKVSPTTKFSVRGSYGAFQMLHEGMKVKFTYKMHSNEFLEITELEQLPDNTLMFEH